MCPRPEEGDRDRERYLDVQTVPTDVGARRGDLTFAVRRGINCWTDGVDINSHLEGFNLNIPAGAKGGRDQEAVKIVNLYIPPIRAAREASEDDIEEALRWLPRTRSTIWCRDFNAHNHQRDPWID